MLLAGQDLYGRLKEEWREIEQHIERFLSADVYLVSTPMWNFHIPYMLKHYLDLIVQPRYLFRYTETGAEGLVKGKRMVVITRSGRQLYRRGDAAAGLSGALSAHDLWVCGHYSDIEFVIAQPMDRAAAVREEKKLAAAVQAARELALRY